MLETGACAFALRNKKQRGRRIISLFMAVSLTGRMREVFTAPYISQTGTYVKPSEEATMEQDDKTGKVTTTIQEVAYYNLFLTEAILELLAEKGILTGEEVLERVKKLKSESPVQFRWMQ
jgi:hypothetical protein